MMKAAIIIAGALIAAAILVTGRWQIVADSQIYRLDRWTGNVVACSALAGLAEATKGNKSLLFYNVPCTPERHPLPSADEFFGPKR